MSLVFKTTDQGVCRKGSDIAMRVCLILMIIALSSMLTAESVQEQELDFKIVFTLI